jgi:cyclopropane fatty-acyl-phospholipid synthase-like methyltransferase
MFRTFLDKETLMYSSAIYDAVAAPQAVESPSSGLVFKGSLEEAQWRKLDTLCDRAQLQPGQQLLDIGFGWGGLSIHAAKVSQNRFLLISYQLRVMRFESHGPSSMFVEIWVSCNWYHS